MKLLLSGTSQFMNLCDPVFRDLCELHTDPLIHRECEVITFILSKHKIEAAMQVWHKNSGERSIFPILTELF
jgi:hypothetical protein